MGEVIGRRRGRSVPLDGERLRLLDATTVLAIEEYIARRWCERYAAIGRKVAQRDRELLDRLA